MSDRPSVWQDVVSRADSVRVRNVLNPLLWLSAITLPVCVTGATIMRDEPWIAGPLLTVGLLCPISAICGFFLFAFRDPKRLHSEEYLIAQQRLMLEHKGEGRPVDVNALPAVTNPEIGMLPGDSTNESR